MLDKPTNKNRGRRAVMLIAASRLLAATLLSIFFAADSQAQWEALAAKVPKSSNAILLVDVDKLLASPIAKQEQWSQKLEKAFEGGLLAIPPGASRIVEAAELDFETWQPRFELALLQMSRDVSLVNLARQTRGRADMVANLPAVVLPHDAYVLALDKRLVAGLSPADRQATVRWLREVLNQDKPALSPYLMSAIDLAKRIDIVEALDMQDAIPADVIRNKIGTSDTIARAGAKVDVEKLVGLLSTLRGVTFEIVFKDRAHARFLVDFGDDAAALSTIGKPLLLEILRKHGAWIEDFDGWKPSVNKQQFVLTGTLTATGMRKVLSLIDAPVATLVAPGESSPGAEESSAMAYASFAYFKSIKSILAEIRTESKDSVTLGQNAAWIDRWARKIERLPIMNVDPDLLDYGAFVVAKLRGSSDSLKGIGINSAYRSAGLQNTTQGWVAGGYSGYYGRYVGAMGYFEDTSADAQRRQVRIEERTKGAADALSQIRTIDEGTAAARRIMTQRYKMEF